MERLEHAQSDQVTSLLCHTPAAMMLFWVPRQLGRSQTEAFETIGKVNVHPFSFFFRYFVRAKKADSHTRACPLVTSLVKQILSLCGGAVILTGSEAPLGSDVLITQAAALSRGHDSQRFTSQTELP